MAVAMAIPDADASAFADAICPCPSPSTVACDVALPSADDVAFAVASDPGLELAFALASPPLDTALAVAVDGIFAKYALPEFLAMASAIPAPDTDAVAIAVDPATE